jgi:hypothetical protein
MAISLISAWNAIEDPSRGGPLSDLYPRSYLVFLPHDLDSYHSHNPTEP